MSVLIFIVKQIAADHHVNIVFYSSMHDITYGIGPCYQ